MANKSRGEVEFTAGEETYVFRFGTNEQAEFEAETGEPNIFAAMAKGLGINRMRTLLRVALQRKRPQFTDQQAGDLIDEIGLKRVSELVGEVLKGLKVEGPKAQKGSAGKDS